MAKVASVKKKRLDVVVSSHEFVKLPENQCVGVIEWRT
jgi:hypothetical protein